MTDKEKAAAAKAAKAKTAAAKVAKDKRALSLKKQVVDLTTFKKQDSVKWTSKTPRQRREDTSGTGIVGLKGLGNTTKITRARAYKNKK
tara:strand:+ start:561 stop:827 length:267 start_codon:yes stop_codon:yes gene_type:complete